MKNLSLYRQHMRDHFSQIINMDEHLISSDEQFEGLVNKMLHAWLLHEVEFHPEYLRKCLQYTIDYALKKDIDLRNVNASSELAEATAKLDSLITTFKKLEF